MPPVCGLLLALVAVYAHRGCVPGAEDPATGEASRATTGNLRAEGNAAAAGLLVGYTLIPLATILAVSAFIPLYHVRYVFTYAAAYYIVLAAGENDRLRRWRGSPGHSPCGCSRWLPFSLRSYFTNRPTPPTITARPSISWPIAGALAPYSGQRRLRQASGALLLRRWHRLARPAPSTPHNQAGAVLLRPGLSAGPHSSVGAAPHRTSTPPPKRRWPPTWDRVARCIPGSGSTAADTVTDPNEAVRNYLDQHFLKLEDVGFAGSSCIRVQQPSGVP